MVKIGRHVLDNFIMNASGPRCTFLEELDELCKTKNKCIVTKTTTLHPRSGNPHPRVSFDSEGNWSINSVGLANPGSEFYRDYLNDLKQKYPDKLFVCSVAGSNSSDLCKTVFNLNKVANIFEINLSCPNLIGKRQLAFDMDVVDKLISDVKNETDLDLWVKLPPYQDFSFIEDMAYILHQNDVKAAVCINSPSGLYLDCNKQTYIHPNGGMGGVGGIDILPIALWNVRKFFLEFKKLQSDVSVIGVGGIRKFQNIEEHIVCGAKAVQIGTWYLAEGPKIFNEMGILASERNIEKLYGTLEVLEPEK